MEEVEFLCDRIGIMDAGKLIELGTLEQFRSHYGKAIVVKQQGDHTVPLRDRIDYQFFATVAEANQALDSLPDKRGVMVRDSNLEDIFVKLTGHQLN